jgi:hypothetical protein
MSSLLFRRKQAETSSVEVSSRLPGFCVASVGAACLVAGVLIVVLEKSEDEEQRTKKRMIGFILCGVGGVVFAIGFVWYCVVFRRWKAAKNKRRKRPRGQAVQRDNRAFVVDDQNGYPSGQSMSEYSVGYPQSIHRHGQYPINL